MKLGTQSHASIASALQKALNEYSSKADKSLITDLYLQPDAQSGDLVMLDDEDTLLLRLQVSEWVEANPEDFYTDAEMGLKKVLNQLREEGILSALKILKPYSFVLIDEAKETVAELMLVDDEDTLLLSGELLKGLDEELDTFLKDLLEQ